MKQKGFKEDDFKVSSMSETAQVTTSPSHTDLHRKTPPGFPPNPPFSSHSTSTRMITTVVGNDVCLLEPTSKNSLPESIPTPLLVSDLVQMGRVDLPNVVFSGWGERGRGWKEWVETMSCEDKYVETWRKAGIENAIWGSVNRIKRDRGTMEALMGFWCPATRSFVLPWGEITFTLEDAYVLGNFPIRGELLQRDLNVEEERLRQRLVEEKDIVLNGHPNAWLGGKVSFGCWLDWFVKLEGDDELRHLGFLAYWLSKYVIPSKPAYEVSTVVFGLAARLSRGERMALAPTVLANMYSDLTYITTSLFNCQGQNAVEEIEVWAPFRLLQAWIWEHFVSLRPNNENSIAGPSKVRITQFGSKQRRITYNEAMQILRDKGSFSWRPYAKELGNWVKPEWYTGMCKRIFVTKDSPDWVHDFLAVISTADLIGFSSGSMAPIEKYKPHRVARQLGYDQAIPGIHTEQATFWGLSTDLDTRVEVFIPRMIKSVTSLSGYVKWWDEHIECYQKELKDYIVHKEYRKLKEKYGQASLSVSAVHSGTLGRRRDLALRRRKNVRTKLYDKKKEYKKNKHVKGTDTRKKPEYMNSNGAVQGLMWSKKNRQVNSREEARISEKGRRKEQSHIEGDKDEDVDMKDEVPDIIDLTGEDPTIVHQLNHGHSSQAQEDIQDIQNGERLLIEELEEFKRHGLLNEGFPIFLPIDSRNQRYGSVDNYVMTFIEENGDPYGEEVIKRYPQFFKLIPQHPHYKGLLQQNVNDAIKRTLYLSLWYKLVDLMRKCLCTTCQTNTLEIEQWINEAQGLEILGFDVRHLTAYLKVSRHRLQTLEEAKIRFEKVKRRVEETEKFSHLETYINHVEVQLKIIERKLKES